MKKVIQKLLLLTLVFTLAVPLPNLAFAEPVAKKEVKNTKTEELSPEAELLRKTFKDLLDTMIEVADMMQETEPELAKSLRKTVKYAGRQLVEEDMEAVIRALREGLASSAKKSQDQVVKRLSSMLDIIEGRQLEKPKDEIELEKNRKLREKLTTMIDDQRKELGKTSPMANVDDIDKQTKAVIAGIESAIKEQKNLAKQVAGAGNVDPKLAAFQAIREKLAKLHKDQTKMYDSTDSASLARLPVLSLVQKKYAPRATDVKMDLEGIAKDAGFIKMVTKAGANVVDLTKAAEHCSLAADEMKKAAASLGKSSRNHALPRQEQAQLELTNSLKLVDDVLKLMVSQTPAGKMATKQGDISDTTRQLDQSMKDVAKMANVDLNELGKKDDGNKPKGDKKPGSDLNSAADKMDKAKAELSKGKPKNAKKPQDEAIKELEKQLTKAKKLREKALANAKKKMDSSKQNQLAGDSQKMADKMKDEEGKPSAGQQAMKKAAKSAKQAGDSMDQGNSKKANKKQQKALEEMEEAAAELDEEIAKLEEKVKQNRLKKIEEKLADILEKQKKLTLQTVDTFKRRSTKAPHYTRSCVQSLNLVAKGETTLAGSIRKIRDLFEQEGSTVVFPEVLKDVNEDMLKVCELLGEKKAGLRTQSMQADIEIALEELIGAVRKELSKDPGLKNREEKKKNPPSEGQPPKDQKKSPLIPPIAELRMLNLKQKRINRKTERLMKMKDAKSITKVDAKDETRKLAKRQGKVTELAEEVHLKMLEQQQKQGGQ